VAASGWDKCLAVNEERVVQGRLRGVALAAPATTMAEEVMEPGPTTTRPNEPLAQLVPRLQEKRVDRIIVTTPDGRLVGVAEREAAERALAEHRILEDHRE
jgi:CBS domain-containing protein